MPALRFQRALIFSLLFAMTVVMLPAARADHSQAAKTPGVSGHSAKITLRASGRGAPEITYADGSDLPQVSDPGQGAANRAASGGASACMTLSDMNEDGIEDVITAYAGGNIGIRYGQSKGRFAEPAFISSEALSPTTTLTTDLNGDGHMDIVVGYADAAFVSVYDGTGLGLFSTARNLPIRGSARALISSDFNGDGLSDLGVAASSPSTLNVLFGSGASSLGNSKEFRVWPNNANVEPVAMRLVDVDADGREDIVVAVRGDENGYAVLYGTAGYIFTSPFRTLAGLDVQDLLVTDLNRNGRMDLVISDGSSGELLIYQIDGNRKWQKVQTVELGTQTGAIASGSINGDRYQDLAVIEPGQDKVAVLLGSEGALFGQPVLLDVDSAPSRILTAKLNGDALDDLIIAKGTNGSVVVSLSEPPRITVTTGVDSADFLSGGSVTDLPGPDGKISLREAIVAAVNTPGPQTITFLSLIHI